MSDEKKKMTAHGSSVGADDGQSISKNSKTTIPDPDEKSNLWFYLLQTIGMED